MRTFAIVLGCLAWVLSCYDAVSFFRAGEQVHVLQARLENATGAGGSTEAIAGQGPEHIRQRLERDRQAVASDQLALGRTQAQGLGEGEAKQALAADQAALQADRLMQYTVENFSRTEANQAPAEAVGTMDTERRLLTELASTRGRDLTLAHFLIVLWVFIAGTAFLAFRGVHGRKLLEAPEEQEDDEIGSDLATADDVDG